MNNKKECICTKLCKKLYCRFNIRKKVIDTTASLPKDISDTLSDVNLSMETQGKIVNQINDDYKKDYGTSISVKDEKPVKSFQYHCFSSSMIAEIYSKTNDGYFLNSFLKSVDFIRKFI